MHVRKPVLLAFSLSLLPCAVAQSKPAITLDEFMNATEISSARIAPDGNAAVVATTSPDWQQNRFRDDLWLWTASAGLKPLTHAGHEHSPSWSPVGKYFAFLSDRTIAFGDSDDSKDDDKDKDVTERGWVIPLSGGVAFPFFT